LEYIHKKVLEKISTKQKPIYVLRLYPRIGVYENEMDNYIRKLTNGKVKDNETE
jgi:hypothetical protein